MSNLFYEYLADKVLSYFQKRKVKRGDKFHIQFEKEEQVVELYETLRQAPASQPFVYETSDYQTYAIKMDAVRIVVAATINRISPDFLTFLRNKVGTEDPQFQDTAILFIHNTSLDSIRGGTEGFQKEGMPFHVHTVIKELKQEIQSSNLSNADKIILELALERKNEEIFEDNTSIFEYEEVLEVLHSQRIDKDHYHKFGLFYDGTLSSFEKKEIKQRVKENADLYAKVDAIHKYGNPDNDLESLFDEKGIRELKGKEWNQVEFKDVKLSADNKRNTKPLEYIENQKKTSIEGIPYWERAEGESKAKARIRNIILFNEERKETLTLEFAFDNFLKNEYVKVDRNSEATAAASGKKLRVILAHTPGTAGVSRVTYNDGHVKFEFRIAIVDCKESILAAVKTAYSINYRNKRIVVNTEAEELVLNPEGMEKVQEVVDTVDYQVELASDDQQITLRVSIESGEGAEFINIDVAYNEAKIQLAIKEEVEKPKVITGLGVWKAKREQKESFVYRDDNKIVQGTQEYFAREEFRRNLERERMIVATQGLFFTESSAGLQVEELDIELKVKQAYEALLLYYQVNGLLPSLAYYTEELTALARQYVTCFIEAIAAFTDGLPLTPVQSNLMKVGTIEKRDGDQEIIFTPLHPLHVAYQLVMNKKMGDEEVSEEMIKRLRPANLLPYLYNWEQKIYKPVDQTHSPEWSYYVYHRMPRYNGSRNFVSKLASEKIDEFVEHFSYLFTLTKNAPLKLNLINLGDCREILQGIFEYYRKAIKKKPRIEELIPMDICIYGKENTPNAFEEFSFYEDPATIKETFEVRLDADPYSEEDMLNIFREKVHFYMKGTFAEEYEYCHIAFYQMDPHISETYSNMEDITTGVSFDGLMAGIPSVYLAGSYRTGFGTQYMEKEKNLLLSLAVKLNALARTARHLTPFDQQQCIVTAMADQDKMSLDKIYDCAHWVTFIEPKVNLNFFKNDAQAKDLLIIHYSDQYTTSSSYDAITVTRKSSQYQMIIEEFLTDKGITNAATYSPHMINLFNAVNGDWLLRLISHNGQFPREKLSILSAIKIALSYFYHPNILWVPISLEEILRVSGGVGLKKSEGLFSTKNLGEKGPYSDDLLLVGIEENEGRVQLHYYPVEVKIGKNNTSVIQKAIEQAKKTRELFEEYLKREDSSWENRKNNKRFTNAMYRNFLVQLILVSAEKMKLYDIWPEQDWDRILHSPLRTRLLNDEYDISNGLDTFIGKGAVISFKKDIHFRSVQIQDDIQVLEFTEQDGYSYITKSIETLKGHFLEGHTDFKIDQFLYSKYKIEDFTYKSNSTGRKDKLADKVADPTKEVKDELEKKQIYLSKPMEILFGHRTEDQTPVKWYPTSTDKLMHTNTGIIGTMGTGKTQFTKSMITQISQNSADNVNGTKIGILIFDYKGDYIKEDFVQATNAQVYELYHLPFNPLALFWRGQPRHLLPLHTANGLKETISTAFNLGNRQQQTLRDLIMDAYKAKGIEKGNPETWHNPAPTISDLYGVYCAREDMKEDSLYAALDTLYNFEIFEPDTDLTYSLFEMVNGVTVINLSGMDEQIQNLVVAITLDVFYTQMQIAGHSMIDGNYREITKMILVDEADNFLSKDFKSLKKILKEGREFGVGTILSTQFLSHFSTADNDYANYILTWIVHNVSDINTRDVRYIFNTKTKTEEENIVTRIKNLEKHYSLVNGEEGHPVLMKDKAFWQLLQENR